MAPISVMIKPASGNCNLRCKYCFYFDELKNRQSECHEYMSNDIAFKIIDEVLKYADGSNISIAFQGGEPLLVGIDYYVSFIKYLKNNNIKNSNVQISIQTNGTLINKKWAKFFSENSILVGLSLDGDETANQLRVFPNGDNSFNTIKKSIKILDEYKVEYNLLSVINSKNVDRIEEIYNYFKSNGYKYLQFIPCLNTTKSEYSYEMSNEQYYSYLITVFKLYLIDYISNNYISIRYFDNLLLLLNGYQPEQCGVSGFCSKQIVFESNGDIYPCDFYCIDKWLLGNINANGLEQISKSEKYIEFIKESSIFPEKCHKCNYQLYCRGGGCKRQRLNVDYCNAYLRFFPEAFKIIDSYK